jgi:hypothetical protein
MPPTAGSFSTDDQHALDRGDADRIERLLAHGLLDAGAHQIGRLAGGALVVVGVGPGALLADIDLHILEGVEPRPRRHVAERRQVQLGRAGGDDHAVEPLLLDVLDHVVLRGVGAGEHRGAGHGDAVLLLDALANFLDVDVVGDVAAAVADVDADLALLLFHHGFLFIFSR